MEDFTENDWNHFHDVVLHSMGKSFDRSMLEILYGGLPDEIKEEAESYGLSDTCVREKIIEFYAETN